MTHSAYIVYEEDSKAARIMALTEFNKFIEWSFLNGSRPSEIHYGPSILEMITMPTQGEFFPEPPGPVWWEDEYIPSTLLIK